MSTPGVTRFRIEPDTNHEGNVFLVRDDRFEEWWLTPAEFQRLRDLIARCETHSRPLACPACMSAKGGASRSAAKIAASRTNGALAADPNRKPKRRASARSARGQP